MKSNNEFTFDEENQQRWTLGVELSNFYGFRFDKFSSSSVICGGIPIDEDCIEKFYKHIGEKCK